MRCRRVAHSSPVFALSGDVHSSQNSSIDELDYPHALGTNEALTTNLSSASGLHFERVGEWVLVFEPHCTVGANKRKDFVRDCFSLLEYSRDVHQVG